MIRFALKCANAHDFDSWFASAAAFDRLKAAGGLACPDCGSSIVEKAVMAPRVSVSTPAQPSSARSLREMPPEGAMRQDVLERLRREVERKAEYVGRDFADEARAIHNDEAPARSIWGEARGDEARALIEDGVPVAPLPFKPTRKLN